MMGKPRGAGLGLVCGALFCALLACKQGGEEKKSTPAASATAATPATPATPSPAPSSTPTAAKAEVDAKGIPAIPDGHSNPPSVAEWSAAPEVNTQEANSRAKDCFMKIVREWLKVHCEGEIGEIGDKDGIPKSQADYYESVTPGKMADFVMRLKKPATMKMRIHKKGARASLFVNWPATSDRPVNVALAEIKE